MNYIDLSHELRDKIPVYPRDPDFILKNITLKKDNYSMFKMEGGLHTGTHLDAPYHYMENGKKVNELNLNSLIGKANILEIGYVDYHTNDLHHENAQMIKNKEIMIDTIEKLPDQLERIIILKTGWFNNWGSDDYFTDNPYLSKELAKLLVENGISGIAIDIPNVDKQDKSRIHKILLKNNIWIVENITNVDKLIKDTYQAYFIPLNINAEASYVRAFVK
ncbi:kynurenine formamidase [Methanobrevibacter cuticularis]|uniref:Kynurenine formamidase n=1 Tax=Methanobrevibacter cuticularis TaxID=47311 RepID=A0A166CX43_9EURY|nr:cyclase family protein [Methanobrevibacter cuticularis]KZX17407.1 kynurenine formamidase [Methanobrevibacter cuticularis]